MITLNSSSLSIETFDSILAKYKIESLNSIPRLSISSEFLYAYLQGLTTKLLSDRVGMYKILDALKVSFENDNIDSPIKTVVLNSNTLEDVCDAHGILPNEIDVLIENAIQNAFNSYVYKIEEDDSLSAQDCVYVKIFKGSNAENILENPSSNEWRQLITLKFKKPTFSKAIQIHDEFKKRFIQGTVIAKEFIISCLSFVAKENGESLPYEEFIATFNDNLVLAYEFLIYFIEICYSRDLKKKR